jgi:hypothetical protein
MFSDSGCTYTDDPDRTNKGPFCASDCNASESKSMRQSLSSRQGPFLSPSSRDDNWDDDNLYSNSNESSNDPIANESHQQSVQATATYALAGASSSLSSSLTTTAATKPPKQICYYPGNKKCPKVPQKSTASSCSCK